VLQAGLDQLHDFSSIATTTSLSDFSIRCNYTKTKPQSQQWRTQKIFMVGFMQWHMLVICIWYVLFVTSQFDVISKPLFWRSLLT